MVAFSYMFQDQEQLRLVTESVLISLVVQCSNHSPREEFLLFAIKSLCNVDYINWDTLLPSLLSAVSTAEISLGQGSQATAAVTSTNISQPGMLPSTNTISVSSTFQSNPASPLTSAQGVGSPVQSANEPSSALTSSPVKFNDIPSSLQQSSVQIGDSAIRDSALNSLRQLCCKIILISLDSSLKPVTYAEIFNHMQTWLVNWDQRHLVDDDSGATESWKPYRVHNDWLHSCLDVIWLLVKEDKCRVPFYELLHSGLQFIENIPNDESLFTLIMEIRRRRDMMAMHMQMLDQHLHCPTFGTHRFLPLATPHFGGEAITNSRYSPITYPSVLGEPLHGEVIIKFSFKYNCFWKIFSMLILLNFSVETF